MITKLVFFATLFLFGIIVNATVLTVNNNAQLPGSPGQYSSLQVAIDAASAGDTILVSGSPNTYGSVDVTKSLTLFGPGFNPQDATGLSAQVNTIKLKNNTNNTTIGGFKILYMIDFLTYVTQAVSNYTIKGNELTSSVYNGPVRLTNNVSNVYIYNNIIDGGGAMGGIYAWGAHNVYVYNNILYRARISNDNAAITIKNNLFLTDPGASVLDALNSSVVSNNIFYSCSGNQPTTVGATAFINNLTFNCTPGSLPWGSNVGSGNLVNQDPLFVNPALMFDYLHDFGLQTGSPCHNAGSDGTDIGPSGGAYPFTNVFPLTGMQSIPFVEIMNITGPSSVPVGAGNINIYVKGVKHN